MHLQVYILLTICVQGISVISDGRNKLVLQFKNKASSPLYMQVLYITF